MLCHDLLAPEGYGEIIGGEERTPNEGILKRIDEETLRTLSILHRCAFLRRRPHVVGLGVDRVVSWLAGATHIK